MPGMLQSLYWQCEIITGLNDQQQQHGVLKHWYSIFFEMDSMSKKQKVDQWNGYFNNPVGFVIEKEGK